MPHRIASWSFFQTMEGGLPLSFMYIEGLSRHAIISANAIYGDVGHVASPPPLFESRLSFQKLLQKRRSLPLEVNGLLFSEAFSIGPPVPAIETPSFFRCCLLGLHNSGRSCGPHTAHRFFFKNKGSTFEPKIKPLPFRYLSPDPL